MQFTDDVKAMLIDDLDSDHPIKEYSETLKSLLYRLEAAEKLADHWDHSTTCGCPLNGYLKRWHKAKGVL